MKERIRYTVDLAAIRQLGFDERLPELAKYDMMSYHIVYDSQLGTSIKLSFNGHSESIDQKELRTQIWSNRKNRFTYRFEGFVSIADVNRPKEEKFQVSFIDSLAFSDLLSFSKKDNSADIVIIDVRNPEDFISIDEMRSRISDFIKEVGHNGQKKDGVHQ